MKRYFSAYGVQNFYILSVSHIVVIITVVLISVLIYLYRIPLRNTFLGKKVRFSTAIILVSSEILLQIWYFATGTWDITYSLPLHLCGISIIAFPVLLITKSYSFYEVLFFWGIAGTTQAILTPDLWYGFPHFIFFQYFITHGLIVLACIWMTFVEGFRPKLRSVWKCFFTTNILAFFILIFNFLSGSNYLYLMEKPEKSTLLDFLSPWPWYILQLEILVLLMCFLCYLPFVISDKIRKTRYRG